MKKRYLYYLGMIVLAAWLISSTSIIAQMSSGNQVKKIDINELPLKESVCWNVDAESHGMNLTETVSFMGHAFVTSGSKEASPNRKVFLIFRGKTESYEVSTDLYYVNLGGLFFNRPKKNGGNWEYGADFSTLNIKDGTYDFLIYCWENETAYGLTDTGYQITKQNGSFIRHPARGELVEEQVAPTQDEPFSVAIDTAAITGTGFTIKGWAVVPEQDCTNRKVYIELTDEQGKVWQYAARSEVRQDVSRGYNEIRYGYCGYMMSLPEENLPDGSWEFKLLIDHGGEVWESYPYGLIRNGDEISVRSYAQGGRQLTTPLTPAQDRQNMGKIEHLRIQDDTFYISGWALMPDYDSTSQSVYIELTDETGVAAQYTTTSMQLEVVAAGLEDTRYLNSGYAMSIPAQELTDGTWTLRILVKNEGKVWASIPYTLKKEGKDVAILLGGEKVTMPLAATRSEKFNVAIDGIQLTSGYVTFRGWCVAPGQNCLGQTVSIELTDEQGMSTQYRAASLPRVDVAGGYGSPDYANCGYWLTLPVGQVPNGGWQLRFLIDKNGEVWESNLYNFTKTGDSIEIHP